MNENHKLNNFLSILDLNGHQFLNKNLIGRFYKRDKIWVFKMIFVTITVLHIIIDKLVLFFHWCLHVKKYYYFCLPKWFTIHFYYLIINVFYSSKIQNHFLIYSIVLLSLPVFGGYLILIIHANLKDILLVFSPSFPQCMYNISWPSSLPI